MARPPNPALQAAIKYAFEHPKEPVNNVAKRFQVNAQNLYAGMTRARARQKAGRPAISSISEARMKLVPTGPSGEVVEHPFVKPPPPMARVDDELTRLAREAMAVRLRRLGDPTLVAKESTDDFQKNTLLILERFDLLQTVEGKPKKKDSATSSVDRSFAKALMGELPDEADGATGDDARNRLRG